MRGAARRAQHFRARRNAAGGADVPCQRLEPALWLRHGRRQAGVPGAGLDGKSLYELFEAEKVTVSAGVPTVWLALLMHTGQNKLKFSTLNRTVIGGSACPPAMIKTFQDEYGVQVLHAWGMTEMSRSARCALSRPSTWRCRKEQQLALQNKQGRNIFGADMKIVDGDGKDLPWDGKVFGDLLVRGPWITSSYFKGEGGDPLVDGWFPTGDVATIDPDGYMQITDRSKDVIKTGGEWISTIDLENIAVRPSGGGGGGGDRLLSPEVGRTAAADRGEKTRRRAHARGIARVLRRQSRQMVDARRRCVRRAVAAHGHGQIAEDQAARGLQKPQAADRLRRYSCVEERRPPQQSLFGQRMNHIITEKPGRRRAH